MIGLLRSSLLATALAAASVPAHAGQLCGWLVESLQGEDLHQFEFWLQSEGEADVVYKMRGQGVVAGSSRVYAPGSGTYSLHARKAVKVWGFGTTLNSPADIDIVAEIRSPPKDVFSNEETPLLAKFSFQRRVAQGETAPPQPFGSRQCVALAAR